MSGYFYYYGSVGIIGGADGPTAILVSGSIVFTAPALTILCLFVASTIGWIITKNK